jgi:RNA polymerase sigma-70 factor (ECF subfamily)
VTLEDVVSSAMPLPSSPPTPDEDVVARVVAGDVDLFEVIMRRYNRRLYRVARSIVRDDGEAEDVLQHAYVEAFAHLAQFEGRARFSTWLTRIVIHEALARTRRRGRFVAMDDEGDDVDRASVTLRGAPASPEEQAFAGELRSLIESSIEALPASYRSIFVLREVEGMSTAETASCMEVSEDVVKTRLLRARGRLRDELQARAGPAIASAFPFGAARCDRVVETVLRRIKGESSGASSR